MQVGNSQATVVDKENHIVEHFKIKGGTGMSAHVVLKALLLILVCMIVIGVAADSAAKPKWYQGGTLHRLSALEWQKAAYANKLATCADFIAHAWVNKLLKNEVARKIHGVDDLKPLAVELVAFMDAATKPEKDPLKNKQLFGKQDVSELAAMGMLLLEWLK